MPIVDDAAAGKSHKGVYAALMPAVQAEIQRRPGGAPPYWHDLLAALRAGEPVEVPGWLLRKSTTPPTHAGYNMRAAVSPDDRVTWHEATAADWLEEHGL
ncbi:hypothetical protein ABQE93_24385 [Mycolicibacterium sp. XJ662]